MRAVAGIIAGLVAGFAAIAVIAYAGGFLYPVPVDAGTGGMLEQSAAALSGAPMGAKLIIVLSWFSGGFAAAWVARLISRSNAVGWIAGGVIAVITMLNIFIIPFPAWMQIASLAMPLLGAFAAMHLLFPGGQVVPGEAGGD